MGKIQVSYDENRAKEYRRQGLWGDATLLDYWMISAKSFPDKKVVVDDQGTGWTYRELDELSDRLAGGLQSKYGLLEGDIASVQLPNWAEFTLILIACLKLGVVVNPLLTGFRESELTHRLSKCESRKC